MKSRVAKPEFKDYHFPKCGKDTSLAFDRQPNRQAFGGEYARTTADCANVRAFDGSGRKRGGSRYGLSKLVATRPGNIYWITQELASISGTAAAPGGGSVPSQSGRVVTLIVVSQGYVFTRSEGETVWTATTNSTGDTPPLNSTGIVFSTSINQKQYFADGTNWVFYTPSTNVLATWTASAGSLPVDADDNTPRLICTWRGRVVLSGLLGDPQNWFMSRSGVPTDFDYSPASETSTQAIAGNNTRQLGTVGDDITALIPYTDDILVFGGDHTIFILRGDPMDGGRIDLVSDEVGMAFGCAWCKDPRGVLYFWSNKMGIMRMTPGQTAPECISQQIQQEIIAVNTGENSIRMAWDAAGQGLVIFVTPLAAPAPSTHYFYDARSMCWFPFQFANDEHSPVTIATLDGNAADDRVVVIGSWDGYVRVLDPTAIDDDGTPIESSVLIGPIVTKNFDAIHLFEMQAVMGLGSGDVTYEVYVGRTAELALASAPVRTGVFGENRSNTKPIDKSGHAIYIKLTSTNQWAMEAIRLKIVSRGDVRMREG